MNRTNAEPGQNPRLVIITGLSGSGMSSATNAFEDLGYFCVDNLPITMLETFSRLLVPDDEDVAAIEKAALVINIRERHFLSAFPLEMKKVTDAHLVPYVVFFEASDEVLRQRFSETRRPHPADLGVGLVPAIQEEKTAMEEIRSHADLIIDTSELTVHSLRKLILDRFGHLDAADPLKVQIISFGHKYGTPRDVDLMFDVRYLPNPYFEKALRAMTGEDEAIVDYLNGFDEVKESIDRFTDLLMYLLPLYRKEGKSYLSIGIGCTGGRHRSVMVANALQSRLKNAGNETLVVHRDVQK